MTETFERDTFVPLRGTVFKLADGAGDHHDLELIEVSNLREKPAYRSFSLLFAGPEGHSINQGMYDLEHESLGTLQIFLVPIGMENGRPVMEALFNLLRPRE